MFVKKRTDKQIVPKRVSPHMDCLTSSDKNAREEYLPKTSPGVQNTSEICLALDMKAQGWL